MAGYSTTIRRRCSRPTRHDVRTAATQGVCVPLTAFTRDDDTAGFLDAAARGEFLVRRCSLGHVSEPSAESCTTCLSPDLEWVPASGRARLISWSVTYSAG